MAACDLTELITNASPYRADNLGGEKNQRAFRAYAQLLLAGSGTTITGVKNAIGVGSTSANVKLGPLTPTQLMSGEINMLLQAATRSGVSVPATMAGKMAIAAYLMQLDEDLVEKVRVNYLCTLLSALIP